MRKPFQGILNIIRFNWHFYILSIGFLVSVLVLSAFLNKTIPLYIYLFFLATALAIITSLLVSYYVYDLSDLYKFYWLKESNKESNIVNINAGFDETSVLLKEKFKNSNLIILDFYNPEKHTEISIKRARKAYPPYNGTKQINTSNITIENNSADKIFLILAAHEIRNEKERIIFFKELNRILKPSGKIFVTEHLRDGANFVAYTVGAFHFFSKSSWQKVFYNSELKIESEIKITPFISNFTLIKNGSPS